MDKNIVIRLKSDVKSALKGIADVRSGLKGVKSEIKGLGGANKIINKSIESMSDRFENITDIVDNYKSGLADAGLITKQLKSDATALYNKESKLVDLEKYRSDTLRKISKYTDSYNKDIDESVKGMKTLVRQNEKTYQRRISAENKLIAISSALNTLKKEGLEIDQKVLAKRSRAMAEVKKLTDIENARNLQLKESQNLLTSMINDAISSAREKARVEKTNNAENIRGIKEAGNLNARISKEVFNYGSLKISQQKRMKSLLDQEAKAMHSLSAEDSVLSNSVKYKFKVHKEALNVINETEKSLLRHKNIIDTYVSKQKQGIKLSVEQEASLKNHRATYDSISNEIEKQYALMREADGIVDSILVGRKQELAEQKKLSEQNKEFSRVTKDRYKNQSHYIKLSLRHSDELNAMETKISKNRRSSKNQLLGITDKLGESLVKQKKILGIAHGIERSVERVNHQIKQYTSILDKGNSLNRTQEKDLETLRYKRVELTRELLAQNRAMYREKEIMDSIVDKAEDRLRLQKRVREEQRRINEAVKSSQAVTGQVVSGLAKGIGLVSRHLTQLQGHLRRITFAIGSLGQQLFRFASIPIAGAFGFGAKFASDVELAQVKLGMLFKDMSKGGNVAKDMLDFSRMTPFFPAEVLKSAERLAAAGMDSENVIRMVRAFGDLAGTGEELQQIAEAVADMKAMGDIDRRQLKRFGQAGINIMDSLARVMGVGSSQEVLKLVENNQIQFEHLQQAILGATGALGEYFKVGESRSKTMWGRFTTALGAVQQAIASVFEPFIPVARMVLEYVIEWADKIKGLSDRMKLIIGFAGLFLVSLGPILSVMAQIGIIAVGLSSVFTFILPIISDAILGVGSMISGVSTLGGWILKAVAGAKSLGGIFSMLGTTIATTFSPVLVGAGIVIALGASIYEAVRLWDVFKGKTEEAMQSSNKALMKVYKFVKSLESAVITVKRTFLWVKTVFQGLADVLLIPFRIFLSALGFILEQVGVLFSDKLEGIGKKLYESNGKLFGSHGILFDNIKKNLDAIAEAGNFEFLSGQQWAGFSSGFNKFVNKAEESLKDLKTKFKGPAEEMKDMFKGGFDSFIEDAKNGIGNLSDTLASSFKIESPTLATLGSGAYYASERNWMMEAINARYNPTENLGNVIVASDKESTNRIVGALDKVNASINGNNTTSSTFFNR